MSDSPARVAFVVEQTLGHVTHYQNIRDVAARRTDLSPIWIPIAFDPGATRLVPLLGRNWSARASLRSRRALDALPAADRPEAIFFHTQATALFSTAMMARVPAAVSIDATPINFDSVGDGYGHRPAGDGFLDRRKHAMTRAAFHSARLLVSWSEWARASLVTDYAVDPTKIHVIAPGAARRFFEIGRRRGTRIDGASRPVRLLFVGGDFVRKGGSVLLDVFRGRLDRRCELHLVTRADVAPAPGIVVHRDVRPNSEEILALFAEADLFVLPSLGDCLPVALMEATAAGLPVITTDIGALRESVDAGRSGLVCAPGDPGDLARAIARLVDDASLRLRMGRAAFDLARRKFDAGANDDRLLDLMVELGISGRRMEVA
jgi:glycosyltransferase involved in cell wall biosynthesis